MTLEVLTPNPPVDGSGEGTPPPAIGTPPPDGGTPPPEGGAPPEPITPPDPTAKGDPPPEAVPEHYEVKMADGGVFDTEAFAPFEPVFKELGLNNSQVQTLVDLQQTQQLEAFNKLSEEWIAQSKAHPTIGGKNYEATQELAGAVVARFGPPGLRELLDNTRFGNNPLLLEFAANIGKSMAPDTVLHTGQPPIPVAARGAILYDKSNMK